MSVITEDIKAITTEFQQGNEICQERSKFLLKEIGLPNGLLPLEDIEESGFVESTGFVWLKQRNKSEYKFDKVGKFVRYAREVTAYVEKLKIKKLTGVKVKEFMMWVTIDEICIDEKAPEKIIFKSPTGFLRTFSISDFEIDEPEE